MKTVAIVLAGGKGSRMNTSTKKQYIQINHNPIVYYSIKAFQDHPGIDEIVLVCGKEDIEYCEQEIVKKYSFTKVMKIVSGGAERYDSVYNGLKAIDREHCDKVLIHDGARPFVDSAMIDRILDTLSNEAACVVGVPVKDTMKMKSPDGYIAETLPREKIWSIQTPQSFHYDIIVNAYEAMYKNRNADIKITDDAMVAEYYGKIKIKLIEGAYTNIKITTPEDLLTAEAILCEIEKTDKRIK